MHADESIPPNVSPDSQMVRLIDEFTDQLNAGVLFLTTIGLAISNFLITSQRNAANAARDGEKKHRNEAEKQAEIAKAINRFLTDYVMAKAELGRDTADGGNSFRDVLDNASQYADRQFPDDPILKGSLYQSIGQLYGRLGKHSQAEQLMSESFELSRTKLSSTHPQTAACLNRWRTLSPAVANGGEADLVVWYMQRIKLWDRVCNSHPNSIYKVRLAKAKSDLAFELQFLNGFARFLANCDVVHCRDVARAIDLANKSTQLAANDGSGWNTLGVAQFRHGDYRNSVTSLNKAIYINHQASGTDHLLLAMAHWQLGDHERARDFFIKAEKWMQQHEPDDQELKRFREEAKELLGNEGIAEH